MPSNYHHGNLRAELLTAAEKKLRESGPDQISLRELARETGVSHNAPHRHFPDRQSLLEALAVAGFERLREEIDGAVGGARDDFGQRLRAAAGAFVRFAVDETALLELMFSLAKAEGAKDVAEAADPVYTAFADLIEGGQESGELRSDDPSRLKLLMIATFQGIASLAGTGRVSEAEADVLLDDAVQLFLGAGTIAR
jgi:AcrR family transcriptional regulator